MNRRRVATKGFICHQAWGSVGTAFYLCFCLRLCFAQEDTLPRQLCDREGVHCVEIDNSPLPESDPETGFYTLILSRNHVVLSKFATEGYLIDALWSPDGKYVAVNNRRANSGDYLWVLRLADGMPVKIPRDEDDEAIVKRVTTKFARLSMETFNRRYTTARKWTHKNELAIRSSLEFLNLNYAVIRVDDVRRIEGDKLVIFRERITKVPTK